MRKMLIATPLMLYSLTACDPAINLGKPAPPAERLVCDPLPVAPNVTPLTAFQASNGAWVYYKADVDARDAQIAPYVVQIRQSWFSCSNQLAWNRDYWRE